MTAEGFIGLVTTIALWGVGRAAWWLAMGDRARAVEATAEAWAVIAAALFLFELTIPTRQETRP